MTLSPFAHNSETSRIAALAMIEKSEAQRWRIWKWIYLRGTRGATCDEVEEEFSHVIKKGSPRLWELRRDGWLEYRYWRSVDPDLSPEDAVGPRITRKGRSGLPGDVNYAYVRPDGDTRDGVGYSDQPPHNADGGFLKHTTECTCECYQRGHQRGLDAAGW